MALIPTTLINGHRFGYSSIDFRPLGVRLTDVKDLEYNTSLSPGKVYGTSAYPVGRTRGQQESDGSVTLYREAWGTLLTALQLLTTTSGFSPFGAPAGFMEVSWDAIISYAETPSAPVQTDVLKGCRIKKVSASHSEGNEALVVKIELDIMQILLAGAAPLNLVVI